MGIEYDFKIETLLAPKQVLEIAAKKVGAIVVDKEEPYTFSVHEAFVVAIPLNDVIGKRLMLEGYGFAPTVLVSFKYRISDDPQSEHRSIGLGIAAMLQEINGNAVLLHNGEITLLQRSEKCLVTDVQGYDWIARSLDEIGLTYERRPLESPLL